MPSCWVLIISLPTKHYMRQSVRLTSSAKDTLFQGWGTCQHFRRVTYRLQGSLMFQHYLLIQKTHPKVPLNFWRTLKYYKDEEKVCPKIFFEHEIDDHVKKNVKSDHVGLLSFGHFNIFLDFLNFPRKFARLIKAQWGTQIILWSVSWPLHPCSYCLFPGTSFQDDIPHSLQISAAWVNDHCNFDLREFCSRVVALLLTLYSKSFFHSKKMSSKNIQFLQFPLPTWRVLHFMCIPWILL